MSDGTEQKDELERDGGPPSSITASTLEWPRPGPGTWHLDRSHFEPDCARIVRQVISNGMTEGMRAGFEIMGAPLRTMEATFVNGSFYYRMMPLVGGDRDLPTPPAPLAWLLTRVHPAFRRRVPVAERALAGDGWRAELARWEQQDRPALVADAMRLGALDPPSMDDDALADHLQELVELTTRGTVLHFRLHVSDLGPIGLLLSRAKDWHLEQPKVMAALAGSSPATNAPMRALGEISAEVADRIPVSSLDDVRAASPQAAELLDDFMTRFGWRLTTGYDLQDLTLAELPALVLTAINQPRDGATDHRIEAEVSAAGERAAAELRSQLQPGDREEFDQLLDDARTMYGLRDENGPLTYQWPAGLLRRAMLEAATRLVAAGRIDDERHVFDLDGDELVSVVRAGNGPGPAELRARFEQRQEWKRHEAPELLGPEVEDPPLWTLPKPMATMMGVVLTVMDLIESDRGQPTLDGLGIGTEACVGRARVVTDEVDALTRMEPGDVLVAPFTVPTYNAVLAIAGAVVVENGGLLCHAAVIAREYGIPGLVGVTGVTSGITDGAMVRVDPVAGTIRELEPA